MPIPKPPYPAAFRQQMVELVQAGRKPSELAKEFGCHVTSILTWVRHAGVTTPVTTQGAANAALNAAEREELLELRRKFKQVQMDRCHLKGETGDRLHAVLCAAGYNIQWLLRMIAKKGIAFLQRLYLRLCAIANVSPNGPQVLDAWSVRALTRPALPVFCALI